MHLNYLEPGTVYRGFREMSREVGLESNEDYSHAMFDEETRNRAAAAYNDPSRASEGWVFEINNNLELDGDVVGQSNARYNAAELARRGY
jgi:hypothetical protein